MRLSNTLRRRWERLLTILGMVVLAAIPVLSVRELYWAVTEGGLHTTGRSHIWITQVSDPRWFVASAAVYALLVLLAIAFLGVLAVGWRNDRLAILRNRSKPVLDNAIRLDPESR